MLLETDFEQPQARIAAKAVTPAKHSNVFIRLLGGLSVRVRSMGVPDHSPNTLGTSSPASLLDARSYHNVSHPGVFYERNIRCNYDVELDKNPARREVANESVTVEKGHDYQAPTVQSASQPHNKSQVWLSRTEETQKKMVRRVGIEPTTYGLRVHCSAN